jgi:hypothetical protein
VTDDTAASGDRANGALDYAYVGHLPGRCTYCGFHVKTQGHRVGCHRSAPVTPEIRISKSATESKDSDFIDNVRSQDAREAARQRANATAQRPRRATKRSAESGCTGYGLSALERESKILHDTPGGRRNHQLNTSAFNLGQLVASGDLPEQAVVDALSYEARHIGLRRSEIGPSLRSGLNKGKATPRRSAK